MWVSAKVNTHILDTVMFGSILTVDDTDMTVLLITAVLTAVTALPLFNHMLLASLNPSLAHVRGVRVHLLEYVFVLLLTVLTVACVKIIGAVLVEALLLIPAAAARNLNRSMRGFVLWSIAFSTVSCIVGIYAPMRWDLPVPSGGAIILAAAFDLRRHDDRSHGAASLPGGQRMNAVSMRTRFRGAARGLIAVAAPLGEPARGGRRVAARAHGHAGGLFVDGGARERDVDPRRERAAGWPTTDAAQGLHRSANGFAGADVR